MKQLALVLSVRAPGSHRFAWQWRSEDGTRESAETFQYFFECCQDARKAGYECKFSLVDTPAEGSKRASAARAATRA